VLNPTSSADDVRRVIEHFAASPARAARSTGGAGHPRDAAIADPGQDGLRSAPLLAGVPDSVIESVRARAEVLDVAAGAEVIRRWDSDRSFYFTVSGRYDIFIGTRLVRTLGPGDHFGELAARDWGGGYGYTRLATVRCHEPGRLLRLSSGDFQWLTDTEPAVGARLASIAAERLQQR
jgi:uridine kinase